jgi:hypothetical protein
MTEKSFTLIARVSSDNPKRIRHVLKGLVSTGSITPIDEGFLVRTTMRGGNARELNRTLLSALRRVERKTRLRAEWTRGATTERFFDYVPKGVTKARDIR